MNSRGSLLAIFSVSSLLGQSFGTITGTITDPSGAVTQGITVTVANPATSQIRNVTTNESGNYSVPSLVPGIYDVAVQGSGFKRETRRGVDLEVDAVARIDFTLQLGDLSQQIEVTGGAPLLATESASLGSVIENRRIVELPLNGRNALSLIALNTNVTIEGGAGGATGLQGGARAQSSFSIAGQRLEYNHYTLDGVENTDPNFNSYIVQPSVDALQEFRVQTGVYSAELGRSVSQVNMTTKPGTNQFHGAAFEFLRNSALDAREWLQADPRKNPFRRNQYGFALGGPVRRDKLFFLANFEGSRDRKTLRQTANVATDKMRAGDFSASGRTIFDPDTRVYAQNSQGQQVAVSATPFTGNVIQPSRLAPISQKVFAFYPRATAPGDNINSNFVRNAPRIQDADQFNGRLDFNQSSSSTWFARYSWGSENQVDASTFEDQGATTLTGVKQAVLANTRLFGANKVNDLRLGWNNFNNDRVNGFAYVRNVQAELGIKGMEAPSPALWGIPTFTFGNGLTGLGLPDPWIARNQTWQAIDSFAVIHGAHSFKFGGEFRRDRYNNYGNQQAQGGLTFNGNATFNPVAAQRNITGFSFADFLLGWVQQATRATAVANAMLRGSSFYAFVQDDWKLTPRITINLGIRYENTRPWYDKYRGILNAQIFDNGGGPDGILSGTRTPILTRPGSDPFYQGLNFHFTDAIPVQAGDQYLGRSLVYPDNNDFAPRIGISWSPVSRWTLRSGFGVFFAKDSTYPVFDMARNMAVRQLFNSDLEVLNSPIGDPFGAQQASNSCSNWSGTCIGAFQVLANQVNRRTPYVMQWLFNIQHQLARDLVLEVGYAGSASHKLERLVEFDQAVLRKGPGDLSSIASRTPWPAYSRIQMLAGLVNANYQSLSAKLTQRPLRGLSYNVSFSWSKSIDNGSAIRNNSGDRLWPVNSYDLRPERAVSQFNVPRRFVTSAVYQLPFGANGKSLASILIQGWETGAILTLADGAPQTVASIGDTLAINALGNTPDATGLSAIPASRSAGVFWNIAAFDGSNPALQYRPGTAGRNTLLRPGTQTLDATLTRNIRITERQSLQFRWEAFNALNHPNWNAPASNVLTPATFGKVTSARTMREMQFALKYIF
jgi:hypothetical protein